MLTYHKNLVFESHILRAMKHPKRSPGGRPQKPPEEKLEQRSIRMAPSIWRKIDRAGLPALRRLLADWRVR